MSLPSLLLFMSVYALAVATPGPGVAALVSRTLARGTAGAVPFILGFVMGDLTWFIAAAAGLSVIAKTYAPLFLVLKYAGCAYLLYIAVTIWRSEPQVLGEGATPAAESPFAAFMGSLLLTLGNPKVMVFFLSIMPLVVDPEEMTWLVGLELGVVIAVLISSILFGYMLLASRAKRLFRSSKALGVMQRANAGVLAGAAVLIARG